MYERRRVTLNCNPDTGRTKQSFRDDADINVLVQRWLGGVPIPTPDSPGMYGDFSEIGTYHEAHNKIADAQAHFDLFPADIRSRFANDPGKMMEFMADPDNAEEAKEMGLVEPDLKESAEVPEVSVPGAGGISGGESPPTEGE